MRRVIAACLLLVLLPGIVLGAAFLSPSVFAQTYYGELGEMYRHLRSAEGSKLVVIGNSGVAFGVDGALLERELRACGAEYTVCNFGLYGAIGSKAMLDLALDTIGKGDLVVFAPEADNRACSLFFSGAELWRSIDSERSLLPILWRSNASGLLGSFVGYVQEKQDILARRGTAAVDAVYARSSLTRTASCATRTGRRTSCRAAMTKPRSFPFRTFFPTEPSRTI